MGLGNYVCSLPCVMEGACKQMWNLIVFQVKFNKFLHPNEHPRAGKTGGEAREAKAPLDFSRFNIVRVDQTLKTIKVLKCCLPQIFVPSAGTAS